MKKISIALVSLSIVCSIALALSPPQYGLWRQVDATFGASPCVEVKEIYEEDGVYRIDLIGCDADVCKGLAFVLVPSYNYGGIKVEVRVLDREGNLYNKPGKTSGDRKEAIENYFRNALRDNPYFVRILDSPAFEFMPTVWLEFKPAVIQFFNDDLSDYYSNANLVAASAFRDICENTIPSEIAMDSYNVGFTTAPINKDSQAALYRQYP